MMFKKFVTFIVFISLSFQLNASLIDEPDTGIGGNSGGSKQSWEEIFKNPSLLPLFPHYLILGNKVSYDHLCLTDDGVRTKFKQPIQRYTNSVWLYDYIYVLNEGCNSEFVMNCDSNIAPIESEHMVKVFKRTEEGPYELAFEKLFELPECTEWKVPKK
jgi:hypothetical protein